MKIQITYHALLREKIDCTEESFALDAAASIADLMALLCEKYETVKALQRSLKVAVNDEFVPLDQALSDGDRVDILPPFGGG